MDLDDRFARALEFEVLVSRAARRGRLDPDELIETYLALEPSCHELIAEPRRFDLETCHKALRRLPRGFLGASQVHLVASLDGFAGEAVPLDGSGFAAKLAGNGRLLVEVKGGLVCLIGLAVSLCALRHEQRKALGLLGRSREPSPPGLGSPCKAAPEGTLRQEESTTIGSEREDDGAFEALALALDVEAKRLQEIDDLAEGAVRECLLVARRELPVVSIHPDLAPQSRRALGCARGRRVGEAVAELGLATRTLHLWVGGGILTDCLSPYVRELRAPLIHWATGNPEALGRDLRTQEPFTAEEALYALAHDFLAADPALQSERAEADRSVGITRGSALGWEFEVVHVAALDSTLCDARLDGSQMTRSPGVLIRVPADIADDGAAFLRSLLKALGARLSSVTLLLEGTAFCGPTGTVLLPSSLLGWAGGYELALPAAGALGAHDFAGLPDGLLQQGTVLSAPDPTLICAQDLGALASERGVRGLDIGGSGLVRAIVEARWRGDLSLDATLSWALVATEYTTTGRPTLDSLAGQVAVAIAMLRRVISPPAPPKPVTRPRAATDGGPTRRIKA